MDRSYRDDIQEIVQKKIDEQPGQQTGQQRWEGHKSDEYQSDDDIRKDPARQQWELKRWQEAERLLGSGPLTLTAWLAYSLEFNDTIQARRAVISSIGGEKLIAKSRFLPRLTLDLARRTATENIGRNIAASLHGLQTLLEFGKDNPLDVNLRASERQALFNYEDTVAERLYEVRLAYYKILLKQQQLAERRKLRQDFLARYERVRKLEKERRVPELVVLTANLSVLIQDQAINTLQREIHRQKLDLLRAAGSPLTRTDFELAGEPERFSLPLERLVDIAVRRSTSIARARADVYEQDRVVRQIIWKYFPSIDLRGGYRDRYTAAGAVLQSNDEVYSVDSFGEHHFKPWSGTSFDSDAGWLDFDGSRWYWGFELELSLFTGLERTGEFRKERALLQQARHLLADEFYKIDLAVRTAYQTVLEREGQAEIQAETVRISKERLRVNERLKELGRITDDALETFRTQFFNDQDRYFETQLSLVQAQESLRRAMRYFEPLPAKGNENASK